MSRALLSLVLLILAACSGDVVTNEYATLQEARADLLFERGWMPDLLPPSAHDIRTSNNLDLSTSSGKFSFTPSEFGKMAALMSPYAGLANPFTDLDSDVAGHTKRGYPAYQYTENSTTWVFMCKPDRGECEYIMWMKR